MIKMARNSYSETIDVPSGVTASITDGIFHVKGPKGELSKAMQARGVSIVCKEGSISLDAKEVTLREKKMFFTYKAHIKNMLTGCTEGFLYKVKVCSGHFPMSVNLKGNMFEIKNFIGEKVPRTLKIKDGADVKINGDIIEVTSNNKETAGQVAADLEKLTKRPGFDMRKFQDGLYIIEKAGKVM